MCIINSDSKYLFSKLIKLKKCFPIPTLKFQKSGSILFNEAKPKFENFSFLNRGAGDCFYFLDIIKKPFYELGRLRKSVF